LFVRSEVHFANTIFAFKLITVQRSYFFHIKRKRLI